VTAAIALTRSGAHHRAVFTAMASPCEVLVDTADPLEARLLAETARDEALRIEHKYSRYREDGAVAAINASGGRPVVVDVETADLLDFAARCHEASDGAFDVTAGVLRRVWRFDGGDRVPARSDCRALLPRIGWGRVSWRRPELVLPEGMEIDLGGLGKEYAVDRAAALLSARTRAAVLVNFGGDLRAVGRRRDGQPWRVGVERPGAPDAAALELELAEGALATSGDARRFLLRDGVRYPHILDPRTARPVMDAPRSVTVLGDSCLEAGMLATFAMLRGADAESFLEDQGVRHWVLR
jgi:thiamine biosynthesis lipoprotein